MIIIPQATTEDTELLLEEETIDISDIIETQNGRGNASLPVWLTAFLNGGVEEVESIPLFADKYCFINVNQGTNFEALEKWSMHYSLTNDFTRLAASRIESRLFSSATLYPDDEYGPFFETMIKKAFSIVYHDAKIEETFWVRRIDRETYQSSYDFFIFIHIERSIMHEIIYDMMTDARSVVTVSRAQNNAINRLQQTFFDGF